MRRLYLAFLRGIAANRFSRIGVILTTATFLLMIGMELLRLTGLLTNAYIGLITYMGLPALFLIGLVMIPIGWWWKVRNTDQAFWSILSRHFSDEDLQAQKSGARLLRIVGLLTLTNVIVLGAIGARMLHFMDSAYFCGTACHSVMNPEWVVYQASPHANVPCVDCHVGEGAEALIDAKLNGMWQVISASFNLYERPIPTPVHNLRPARMTCEKCHWPEIYYGNRIVNHVSYKKDEQNTPEYTTLMLKIGSGHEGTAGSHWHIATANEVRYASVNDKREEMIWVEVRQDDGSFKRFVNEDLMEEHEVHEADIRTMDCIDCHNRATHIYQQPEDAVDEAIRAGFIDRRLPYIKKQAVGALRGSYGDNPAAMEGIEKGIRNFYLTEYPEMPASMNAAIDKTIEQLQVIYDRNIHPEMNIDWGAYPSFLGHQETEGCFRCHGADLEDEEGDWISMECTNCHSILADESDHPFKYMEDVVAIEDTSAAAEKMRYLHQEWKAAMEQEMGMP